MRPLRSLYRERFSQCQILRSRPLSVPPSPFPPGISSGTRDHLLSEYDHSSISLRPKVDGSISSGPSGSCQASNGTRVPVPTPPCLLSDYLTKVKVLPRTVLALIAPTEDLGKNPLPVAAPDWSLGALCVYISPDGRSCQARRAQEKSATSFL